MVTVRRSAWAGPGHQATGVSSVGPHQGDGGEPFATLAAALPTVVEPGARYDNDALRLRADVVPGDLDQAVRSVDMDALPSPQ